MPVFLFVFFQLLKNYKYIRIYLLFNYLYLIISVSTIYNYTIYFVCIYTYGFSANEKFVNTKSKISKSFTKNFKNVPFIAKFCINLFLEKRRNFCGTKICDSISLFRWKPYMQLTVI